jgi:hypothetical protein
LTFDRKNTRVEITRHSDPVPDKSGERKRLHHWRSISLFRPSPMASATVNTVRKLTKRLRKDCADIQ